MTPDQIIAARIEAHRERVQRELSAMQAEREAMKEYVREQSHSRLKERVQKPRRSSASAITVLLARLDHVNRMARNPGWSI